jgi:hypothetical protein
MQLTKEQVALLGLPEGSIVTLDIKEPPKPWQPSLHGRYYIDRDLEVKEYPQLLAYQLIAENTFESKRYAEFCAKYLKSQLKVMQWIWENKSFGSKDCYIYEQANTGKYTYSIDGLRSKPFTPYMSQEQAAKLCQLINDGLYEI